VKHHRAKIILYVSALSMLLAFPVGSSTGAFSGRTAQRKSEMRKPVSRRGISTNRVKPGMWGGEHISLQVAERDTKVEFDCAHATIARSIVRDRRGRFSVTGVYVEEHGGPVHESEGADGYAVRFDGRIEGETMKLTITRVGTKEIIGTFTLVHGREPFIVKCR
jgi:hypothetical protein